MSKEYDLALYSHFSRMPEMTSIIKTHLSECSNWQIICDSDSVESIHSACSVDLISFGSNYRDWNEQVLELMSYGWIRGVIFLGDRNISIIENLNLLKLLQKGMDTDIPVAVNLASAEALIHRLDQHPEDFRSHRSAGQPREEIACQP